VTTKNDVTGDALRTKAPTKEYADGWDRIFGNKKETWTHVCKHNGTLDVGKGQSCNWCGEKEDGTLD
jgi:hypothetical protein